MVAGWLSSQPYSIGLPLELVDSLPTWSQAVRVTPSTMRTTVLTSQVLAYAAGDIIDDLWWRYAEDATIFGVCQYRIVDKDGGRAIADWKFVQLPPPGDGGSNNSGHDIPIQYMISNSSNSSSSSSSNSGSGSGSTTIDDQAAVAIAKRQGTAGDISSTNTTTDDDDPLPLTLPTAAQTTDPGILLRFRFFDGQRLAPKSLLVLPAQLLRTMIFRYPGRAKVDESSGFTAGSRWTISRLSYNTRHCLRLTIRNASTEWTDLGAAVLAVIPLPTEQNRWDAFVAEFTLKDGGVNFARLEAWEGQSSGGAGGDGGCDGGGVMG